MPKHDWQKWSEKKPGRTVVVDLIYKGDEAEPNVWMICAVLPAAADEYGGVPAYWRPAESLPDDLTVFSPAR